MHWRVDGVETLNKEVLNNDYYYYYFTYKIIHTSLAESDDLHFSKLYRGLQLITG